MLTDTLTQALAEASTLQAQIANQPDLSALTNQLASVAYERDQANATNASISQSLSDANSLISTLQAQIPNYSTLMSQVSQLECSNGQLSEQLNAANAEIARLTQG